MMTKIEFLEKYSLGRSNKELAKMYNEYFGTNYAVSTVKGFKLDNGFTSGLDGKWQKGRIPHNLKKEGYEFRDKWSGHWYIKVNGKFVRKHIYMYEQYYNTKVKPNHAIIFLDGNKDNFNKDNLLMVERREFLLMKNDHLLTEDKDLTLVGYHLAKLTCKTYDKKVSNNGQQ